MGMTYQSKTREEILEIFQRFAYGYFPEAPKNVTGKINRSGEFCCGRAKHEAIDISFDTPNGEFTFPISLSIPNGGGKYPVVIMLNFRPNQPDNYCPTEEIIDAGAGVAMIYYNDISTDESTEFDKLGECFPRRNDGTDCSKIILWSYAASRAADYLLSRDDVDPDRLCVAGHSRLGKTALLTGAHDERFKYTFVNDSGCMGAAYNATKHDGGETYEAISKRFPFWFCDNFNNAVAAGEKLPFDQDMLMATVAPRGLCVSSASLDNWADPKSEEYSCSLAGSAWEQFGLPGFNDAVTEDRYLTMKTSGNPGYFLREGKHYFSRHDWKGFLSYIK